MAIQEKFPNIRPSLNLDFANTKTLDPRITFSRASTATYYDGRTVAKAEENLLLRSQEFDNAVWAKSATTVTPDSAVAPDGLATADSVIEDSVNAKHDVYQSVNLSVNTTYSYSVYAKENGRGFLLLTLFGATNNYAYAEFDLVQGIVSRSGTLGTNYSVNSTEIRSAGNGWYRCIVIATIGSTTGTTRQRICLSNGVSVPDANANIVYTGDGTSGLYIWGAQLEQRSSVTAYTVTTTQPITNYIPVLQTAAANVARFDHNPVTGESLGLLIEEQRTNLLTYSSDFAQWSVLNSPILVANAAIAPDGTTSATKVIVAAGQGAARVYKFLTNVDQVFSFFAKAGEFKGVTVSRNNITAGELFGVIDLRNGAIKYGGASSRVTVIPVGGGWYRVSLFILASAQSIQICVANPDAPTANDSTFMLSGDGYSGIYIWGAQLEAGAFPTSYIPTTTSQVTRSADNVEMTGANFSSWYRADEGTLFASATRGWPSNPFQNRLFVLDDGSSANRVQIRLTGDGSITGTVASSSTTQADLSSGSARLFSAALAYKYNDIALVSNGGNAASDASGVVPNGIARALIGGPSVDSPFSGHIRKIAHYPQRLTNTQLQALTS